MAKASKKVAGKKAAKKKAARKKAAKKKTSKKKAEAAGARGAGAKSSGGGAAARIDAMIAGLDDWRGERLARIRELVHEVDPDVVEEWKWRGSPVWSHEGMVAVANAHKDKVKITFWHGARLADPDGLFNAGLEGNRWRAIDLYEDDRLDERGFKALLREAFAYNETHRVPKSRSSRA